MGSQNHNKYQQQQPLHYKGKVLSPEFINCPRDDLIVLISRMLNSLISINDKYNTDTMLSANLTRFHSRTPPGISVYSYLARLARYSSIENAVLIATVYYIDLLSTVYTSFTINSLTVHRFLLAATTVGSKGLCDSFCTNSHYAKVGGVHSTELDILEREFLTRVNYRILPRDLNIKNCCNEKQMGNQFAQERKGSINALEEEKKSISSGETKEVEETVNNMIDQHELKNAGYNVLDLYYKKMIQLIGKEVSIDDNDVKVSYAYIIGDDYDEKEVPNTMIKTVPDTLPDEVFHNVLNGFLKQYKQHLEASTTAVQANSKSGPGTSRLRMTVGVPLPIASPLKRPMDPESSEIPNNKKSSIDRRT